MKAVEFISNTDKEGNIRIDYKLSAEKKNVRVIILYEDELETFEESDTVEDYVTGNPVFDFLKDPEEDIYTLETNKMRTSELLKEIQQLPVEKRIYLVEKTMHSILKQKEDNKIKKAAAALYDDYKNDEELTSFTKLDSEDFYEAK